MGYNPRNDEVPCWWSWAAATRCGRQCLQYSIIHPFTLTIPLSILDCQSVYFHSLSGSWLCQGFLPHPLQETTLSLPWNSSHFDFPLPGPTTSSTTFPIKDDCNPFTHEAIHLIYGLVLQPLAFPWTRARFMSIGLCHFKRIYTGLATSPPFRLFITPHCG